MFSQTAEYALRAVVFLGERPGARWTTQQIAKTTQIPPGYLAKVMQSLVQAGLASSQRGVNGGFALEKNPESVTVYEVLSAVGSWKRITACPLNLEAHRTQLCRLHRELDSAMGDIEARFKKATLSDLLVDAPFSGS